jgi:signal recognition particle subunit SRP19
MVSKGSDAVVLWPQYFDRRLSRAEGRRVSAALAVKEPDAKWIEAAAKKAGLDATLEEKANHPSLPYDRPGRVLVKKAGPKESLIGQVAKVMRETQDAQQTR